MSSLLRAYADYGLRVFPCRADKAPLTVHGCTDATSDIAIIDAWSQRWPHADWSWALPANVVAADVDRKGGQDGFVDVLKLAGMSVDDIKAPQASTPSGGRHIFFASDGRRFKNSRIPGTAIDTKSEGGYVLLPLLDNGREWLRPLLGAALPPAPAWLDVALRREPARSPAEAPDLPISDDDRDYAREALGRACVRIAFAPCGAQDDTRHRECFFVGLLVKRGVLDRDEALAALTRAALAMPAYGKPWRDLEERTEKSLAAGENAEVAL